MQEQDIHRGEPDDEAIETTALTVPEPSSSALTTTTRLTRADLTRETEERKIVGEFIKENMVEGDGNDFGVIPGTKKKTLFKPGAEKLVTLFHCTATYSVESRVENYDTGLFSYDYLCKIINNHTGKIVAEGVGFCSSYESKYRYRQKERICPKCSKPAIIKGKDEYGGGWLCWKKKDGCGAQFPDNAPEIIGQEVAQIQNPDIIDTVNTVKKMSKKRALVDAAISLARCSDLFTQDMEDKQTQPGFTPEQKGQMQEDVKAGQANHAAFNVRDVAAGKTPAPAANGAQKQAQSPQSANGKPPANLPCPKCGEVRMGRSQFPPDKGLDPPDYSRRGFYCYACKFKAYSNDAGCIALEKQGPKAAVLFSDEQPDDTALVNDLANTLRNCPNLKELASNWEIVNMHKNGQGLSKAAVSAKGVEYLLGIKEQRKKELTPKEEEAIPF